MHSSSAPPSNSHFASLQVFPILVLKGRYIFRDSPARTISLSIIPCKFLCHCAVQYESCDIWPFLQVPTISSIFQQWKGVKVTVILVQWNLPPISLKKTFVQRSKRGRRSSFSSLALNALAYHGLFLSNQF